MFNIYFDKRYRGMCTRYGNMREICVCNGSRAHTVKSLTWKIDPVKFREWRERDFKS
jgi:hypothetical protein